METKLDIANKAREIKNTNPSEAYQLCIEMWNEYKEEYNNYDATLTIGVARKVAQTDFNIILDILQTFPDDAIVNSNAGWYLFDKFIKNKQPYEIRDNLIQIEGFLDLLQQKNLQEDASYPCPFTIISFKIIDALKSNLFNARRILDFLNRLNPEFLSKKEDSYEHESRGEIVKSSPLENYYALKTKALLKLEDYDNCLQACDEALKNIENFHYDNKMWFTMRKALSLEHLDQQEESELIFKDLINSPKGSNKWFLYRALAELYFEQKKYKKAYLLTIEAALYGNDPEYLIRLYRLQAQILFKLNRVEDAKICAELVAAILQEKGWQHREEYTRLFNYFNINLQNPLSVKQVHKRASKFWISEKYIDKLAVNGIISTIHKNGKSGHITSDYGHKYFFGKKDLVKPTRNLNKLLNAKVSFYEGQESEKGKKAEAVSILELSKSNLDKYVGRNDYGKITKVDDIGIFVTDICDGNYGLIHKNKLPNDFKVTYHRGQTIEIIVDRINKKGKLDLKLTNS